MSSQRPERVQEALRQEISKIVHNELKDPRLGFITITRVELTRDLRFARVYFSVLGEAKEKHLALKGLDHARGFIKNLVGERVKLKFVPDIAFKIDDSFEHTKELYNLMDKLKKERDKGGAGNEHRQGGAGDKKV